MVNNTESKINTDFETARKWIDDAQQIVVIPHHNPDGDAIGSALGLYNLLKKYGKETTMISPNDFPEFLYWLPGKDAVVVASDFPEKAKGQIEQADLIIMTDFNDLSRIKNIAPWVQDAKARKILIDHHPEPKQFSDLVFSDTRVSATAELLYHFIVNVGLEGFVDKCIAECLFTGIMTDTGSFSYNSSNPETYIVMGALLKYGIDKDRIHSQVFNNFSHQRMQLLGYCLNEKFVVVPEYRTGFISITQEELDRFQFQPGDTEGFVNYPLSVKGVIFSALFIEKEEHIKLSFRSKGLFAANQFSERHFHGGGHRNAAGGECKLDMDSCLKRFVELLPEYEQELLSSDK